MNAMAGPQVISKAQCFIMGGINHSAAIHPTIIARPTSLIAVQLKFFFVNTFVAPPTPLDKIQQVLAPSV